MAFWSDQTLATRLPQLITPFDPAKIDCVSYELGIGDEVYVTPAHDAKPSDRAKRKLEAGDSIVIPRGQFAFLITREEVTVPNDAVAFISIKARIKFRGLVNVSGFHVDPGYSGRLVFSVFNAGASDVILHSDEPAFLIWFAHLDSPCQKPKAKKGFLNIPSELINGIADDTLSLPVLDSRIKALEERTNKILWTFAVLTPILILVAGIWVRSLFDRTEPNHDTSLPTKSLTTSGVDVAPEPADGAPESIKGGGKPPEHNEGTDKSDSDRSKSEDRRQPPEPVNKPGSKKQSP